MRRIGEIIWGVTVLSGILLLLGFIGCAHMVPQKPAPSTAEILHRATDSVATIVVEHPDGTAFGSCVYLGLDKDGDHLYLTAGHLFEAAGKNPHMLFWAHHDSESIRAEDIAEGKLWRWSETYDLALVSTKKDLHNTKVQFGDMPKPGEPCFYLGNMMEYYTIMGSGIVDRVHVVYPPKSIDYLQFTGFAYPGMSGGALFDRFGHLIGDLSAVGTDHNATQGIGTDFQPMGPPSIFTIGIAVPIDSIKRFLSAQPAIEHNYMDADLEKMLGEIK